LCFINFDFLKNFEWLKLGKRPFMPSRNCGLIVCHVRNQGYDIRCPNSKGLWNFQTSQSWNFGSSNCWKTYLDENEYSNIDKDINTSIDEDKDDSDVAYNKPFITAFQK
jgi:hypothetical protein